METFRSKKSLCNYLKIKCHFLPFLSKLLGKTRSLLRKFCSLLVFRSKLRRKGRKSTSRDRRTEAHKTNCEPLFFLRSCKEMSGGVIIYKTSYIRSATYILYSYCSLFCLLGKTTLGWKAWASSGVMLA